MKAFFGNMNLARWIILLSLLGSIGLGVFGFKLRQKRLALVHSLTAEVPALAVDTLKLSREYTSLAKEASREGLKGAFLATGYPFKAKAALDLYLDVFREVFLEARAIRRCGAAALDLAYTATGIFDGFFGFRLSAWDVAAGGLLIEEAGGAVSDLNGGRDFLRTGNLLAGSKGVQAELLAVLGRHAGEAELDRLVERPSVG